MNEMHPVEVTALFATDGTITPLRFRWRGSLYLVESSGRQWRAEDGYHVLVMTSSGLATELLFAVQENRWYLTHPGPKPIAI